MVLLAKSLANRCFTPPKLLIIPRSPDPTTHRGGRGGNGAGVLEKGDEGEQREMQGGEEQRMGRTTIGRGIEQRVQKEMYEGRERERERERDR